MFNLLAKLKSDNNKKNNQNNEQNNFTPEKNNDAVPPPPSGEMEHKEVNQEVINENISTKLNEISKKDYLLEENKKDNEINPNQEIMLTTENNLSSAESNDNQSLKQDEPLPYDLKVSADKAEKNSENSVIPPDATKGYGSWLWELIWGVNKVELIAKDDGAEGSKILKESSSDKSNDSDKLNDEENPNGFISYIKNIFIKANSREEANKQIEKITETALTQANQPEEEKNKILSDVKDVLETSQNLIPEEAANKMIEYLNEIDLGGILPKDGAQSETSLNSEASKEPLGETAEQ